MIERLALRFRRYGALLEADIQAIERAARIRRLAANHHLVHQGQAIQSVHILLAGTACRYKVMARGRRQITALLVPGDCCDLHGAMLKHMDHSVKTLTDCTVAEIPRQAVLDWIETSPRITRALWWSMAADEAIMREWLANVGRHDARQRIAHLFCDLLARLQAIGMAAEDQFDFPLTQEDLGDMTGLSTVHVNRIIQELRTDGLLTLRGKRLAIHDVARLKSIAQFEPAYLYL